MARTAITPVALSRDAGVSVAAGYTTIDASLVNDGASIDLRNVKDSNLILHVKNTYGGEKAVTLKAGDSGYALASQGDLAVAVAATTGEKMIQFDSARFKQSDGKLYLDFATDMTGSIAAFIAAD